MNELLESKRTEVARSLSGMKSDGIRAFLQECLQQTAESLWKAALAVRELETRGEDLSELNVGMLTYLRKIAHGQVLPSVIVRYQGAPRLMDRICALPLPDQERLSGESPTVEVLSAGGSSRLVDPLELSPLEVRQAFGQGKLRSLSEQRGFLEDQRKQAPVTVADEIVTIDRKRRGIVVGGIFVPRHEVLSLLSKLD